MDNNTGCFEQGAKIAGAILVIFIVISLPFTIVMRSASTVLFDPAVIAEGLTDGLLAGGALREVTVQRLLESAASEENDEFLAQMTANLSEEDWRRISEIALPDLWIQEQIDDLTRSLFDWLNSSAVDPELAVNTEPVKRRLIGDGSQEIVEIIVGSWPDCSAEQIAEFERAFRGGSPLPLETCQFPEPFNAVVVARITEEFQQQARDIPSTLDLLNVDEDEAAGLLPAKSQIRQLRFLARWAILVPFAMLGLLMALVVRSLRDLARWWGLPLAIGGGVTVFISLLLMTGEPQWAAQLGSMLDLPPVLGSSAERALLGLRDQIVWRSAIWGVILGAMGAALLAVSLLLPGGGDGSIRLSRRPGTSG